MKRKLQEVTDFKVMSFKECAAALGWNVEEEADCFKVTCDCGNSHIRYSGFIGTEVIECSNCGKTMTDLFSPIPTGNSTCGILSASDFDIEKDEDGYERYWVANDTKGGIKVEQNKNNN